VILGIVLVDEEIHVTPLQHTVEVHSLNTLVRDLAVPAQLILLFDVAHIAFNEFVQSLGLLVQYIINPGFESSHQEL
jgi:hypothetical protein